MKRAPSRISVSVPRKRRRSAKIRGLRVALPTDELKFFDTTKTTTTSSTSGAIFNSSLVLIPQGVTESNRVGRKCVVKRLNMRGNFDLVSATAANQTSDVLRVIVYVDKQTNGAAATVTDILETATYNSFRNLSNTQRFQILYDKSFGLNAPSGQGDGTTFAYGEYAEPWSMNKTLSLPIEYNSTTGALTEITSNNIGVLVISKAGAAKFDYVARVRFSDK